MILSYVFFSFYELTFLISNNKKIDQKQKIKVSIISVSSFVSLGQGLL